MSEHKHHNHGTCACEHHKHEACACGHHNHEHKEYVSCGCGHDHHHVHSETEQKKEIILIGVSALLFVLAILVQDMARVPAIIIFVIIYLLLGSRVLKSATKNVIKGHFLDENFLMSIATIAAFAIGDFAEAVGVMIFFRVGELFEDIATQKSRKQIMDTVDMRPETVLLVHDHGESMIPAKDAKVGDILLVRAGDRIPLDAVVVEGESRIDTAPVTGEPIPVKVQSGDAVVSGCLNTSGLLKVRVTHTLEHSMVTRILHSVEQATASKPKVERFITRFAKVYTPMVVLVAVATAILPSLFTGEWSKWIYTAITFLVISCPCALVLSVPLTFFSGIGVGSRKNILFKGGLAIETLERVKAVVMDKTGTVTKGAFEVQTWVATGGFNEEDVLSMAAECELQSTHPIANSIVRKAKEEAIHLKQPKSVEEIAGKGIRAITDRGEILCGNRSLLETHGVDLPQQEADNYDTEVFVACKNELVGYIVIADAIKEDSKSAIANLKKRGIKTIMLTGDTKENAQEVAEETGIDQMHASLLPEDKLNHLKELRNKYGVVMFVGDGINDAPVLAGADVGAAMGSGADAAIEAADVVFMTSAMQAIPEALEIAKITNRIAKQNIVFALGVKALVVIMGFLGLANMWMAVFADTGVAMLCVLNAIRILRRK